MMTITEWMDAEAVGVVALAARAGVHYATIYRMLRGDIAPSWATCDKLAAATGYAVRPETIANQYAKPRGNEAA